MLRVVAFLLLAGCAVAAEPPQFTVSAPTQVQLGQPIILHVQVAEPAKDVVLFYRVRSQSNARADITLLKDRCDQATCYVWAQPSVYEIEVEGVIKTDAEARTLKMVRFQVYFDQSLPPLPPLPPEEDPNEPVPPRPPADPPRQPPSDPPRLPRPPQPPTDDPKPPAPPTDDDLDGLFGLGPKVRDKVDELVPEEYRDLAKKLADTYRKAAEEVIDGKLTVTNAAKRLRELNGEALTTNAEREAWKPFLDWLGKEMGSLATSGKLTSAKDVVAALSEISLGFGLVK